MKSERNSSNRAEPTLNPARHPGWTGWLVGWLLRHPVPTIVLVSLLAVVVNCYPIVFDGKSYVSPASGIAMVYERWPWLPGMADGQPVWSHGSDTAATMIWGVPVGFMESRSLLDQGELPLWNRYSHAGDTLIGQSNSMLGDPLQWIVILGRGSAEAWDLKFLAAKFLFCVGFGLLILRLLGNRVLAFIYAALAAYCGAYFYINNHPAFFVFAYAPWILLSALAWLDLAAGPQAGWWLVWLSANFACFNAGHVEVAVVLIGGLNLAVLGWALARSKTVAEGVRVLVRMTAGTLIFLGLTAPMWLSFLVSLQGAYSGHETVNVTHLPFALLSGAFDDIFYLGSVPENDLAVFAPGTSLLVLAGCVLSALRWRQLKRASFFWVNSGAILVWGGFIFGWLPVSMLASIPLLNRVGHTHTDFSYLLVIHLTLQSAYGFKCLANEKNLRRAALDCFWTGLVFAGMVLMYCFGVSHQPVFWVYVFCVAAAAFGAPLLFVFLNNRNRWASSLMVACVLVLGFIPNFRFGLYGFGNVDWLLIPGPRTALDAPSQSVGRIQADRSAPYRVVGEGWNFYGDYSAVYAIEDIRSCAPLSNPEFINLIRNFPGMNLPDASWKIELLDPVAAQPLLNLLNVKYVLGATNIAVPAAGFRLWDRSDFGVLENLDSWPRAFFTDRVVSTSSNEEFTKYLLVHGKQPFIALSPETMERQPGLRPLETTENATVLPATHYQLLPNSTAFDIHAPTAGMVCLTEGQAKDFTATANNHPKEVLTVNMAFKGVYLDKPGDYHIEFIYRPRHWRLACAWFWISTCACVVLVLMEFSRVQLERRAARTS